MKSVKQDERLANTTIRYRGNASPDVLVRLIYDSITFVLAEHPETELPEEIGQS